MKVIRTPLHPREIRILRWATGPDSRDWLQAICIPLLFWLVVATGLLFPVIYDLARDDPTIDVSKRARLPLFFCLVTLFATIQMIRFARAASSLIRKLTDELPDRPPDDQSLPGAIVTYPTED